MAEAPLRCNVLQCRKVVEETALVTSCSHIFCQQHGQICINNAKCQACSTPFRNKYDFNMMDLQPSDQYKAMIITGMNPDQALEIAGRSIAFYTYQLSTECRLKDDMIKQLKEEIENLKNYCTTLKTSFKSDTDNVQRVASSLKKELAEKNAQSEKDREQITQYSRLARKLQMELAACKRQLATMRTQDGANVRGTFPTPFPTGFSLNFAPSRSDGNEFNFLQEDFEQPSTPYTPRWALPPRTSE